MSNNVLPTPRPWYLAVSALWHTATGFDHLVAKLGDLRLQELLPGHHTPIRESAWHSSVFALLKINGWDFGHVTAEDFAAQQLQDLIEISPEIVGGLRSVFSPISLEAVEITGYDAVTSLQFQASDESLSRFRDHCANLFTEPIKELCERGNRTEFAAQWLNERESPLLEPLTSDPNKNRGVKAFGSLARSPVTTDRPFVRWRVEMPPVALVFSSLFLTFSDEGLTNPRAKSDGIVIGSS